MEIGERRAEKLSPVSALHSPLSSDIADLRAQLEEARAAMVARETAPPAPVAVDLEAAVSMPIPDNHFVKSAVTLFSSSLRSDIQTYLTRSARYKKMIEKELADAGLPKGLAYLPVIESGYSTTMTSRAGARGMWQFMGETAREYGLRVDWWVDERADPERSTKIAVQYMKDLYRQFNDWPLALAAYNGGPGRIQRALADNNATTFWELCDLGAIPKETRGYVPTFYATLAIASDPATYGFKLAKPDESSLARVELQGPLSLKYLAQVAGVDADTLRDLNPSLRRGIVPPGRASVRVPAKSADAIVARAASLRSEDTDLTVCSYTLRGGDSLKKLARSVGVNVDTLLAMNDLRSPSRVSEGDSVYLPVRARDLGTLLNAEAVYYAVEKGDTLYSIAKKYALTVDELRDLNDISRADKLHRGQKLRVNAPRTLTAGGM
ncbi:MAG TPA: transglycosylase SLT domain-containing protein [Thermoanaerobaculia bacterium]|nr:transglycosylase SLT domain-containing protein [Thermoanaerobaculia bacterium]